MSCLLRKNFNPLLASCLVLGACLLFFAENITSRDAMLGGYLPPPPDLKLFVFESQMRMIFTNSGSDYDRTTRRLRILTFRFPLHFLAVSK